MPETINVDWQAVSARQTFLLFKERAAKDLLVGRVLHGSESEARELALALRDAVHTQLQQDPSRQCTVCGVERAPSADTIDSLRESLAVMANRLEHAKKRCAHSANVFQAALNYCSDQSVLAFATLAQDVADYRRDYDPDEIG